jgi:hypothetical protein
MGGMEEDGTDKWKGKELGNEAGRWPNLCATAKHMHFDQLNIYS